MVLAIGLNSGSSFDGIDAVLIEIDIDSDGHPTAPKFLDAISHDWPAEVGDRVLLAFENKLSLFEMNRLNYEAGAVYAEAALKLLAKVGKKGSEIAVIGYDGQTIYQEPPERHLRANLPANPTPLQKWSMGGYACGTQIGEAAVVAVETDIPTVTHFRPVDHSLGGTGAPLMQYLDFVVFRNMPGIMTLNIGGIANCQVPNKDRSKMMAFDTGPGNVMIDHAMNRFFSRPYDKGGEVAATGKVNAEMMARLLDHPYFHREPPRCAWRLDFGSEYADSVIADAKGVSPEDIVTTLTDFTAQAINQSLREHIPNIAEYSTLVVSGGGIWNKTLLAMLQEKIQPNLKLVLSDEYGLPAQYKEAIKFATLAFAHTKHLANNIPAASGASKFGILGRQVLPPRMATNID
jgi:anhydro-N-acetylmuramic acid kinase